MMAATHRLGGAAIGLLTAELIIGNKYPLLQAATVTGAILGSLIPDIDNPHSSISHHWRPVSIIVSMFQTITRAFTSLLPKKEKNYVRSVIGHRGISHSLTMCVAVSVLLYTLCSIFTVAAPLRYLFIGIPAGMISHLALDMLAGGVPLFSPLSVTRITLAHIKTGGVGEWIFRIIAILLFVAVCADKLLELKLLH